MWGKKERICIDKKAAMWEVQSSNHVPQRTGAGIKPVNQRLLWQDPGLLESP